MGADRDGDELGSVGRPSDLLADSDSDETEEDAEGDMSRSSSSLARDRRLK